MDKKESELWCELRRQSDAIEDAIHYIEIELSMLNAQKTDIEYDFSRIDKKK